MDNSFVSFMKEYAEMLEIEDIYNEMINEYTNNMIKCCSISSVKKLS